MPACFRQQIEQDIDLLVSKYPSIDNDIRYLENLLRDSRVPGWRCQEFVPEWVWRIDVHISAFEGIQAERRCTLVYEQDSTACYFLLLYDNDLYRYEDLVGQIAMRRSEG